MLRILKKACPRSDSDAAGVHWPTPNAATSCRRTNAQPAGFSLRELRAAIPNLAGRDREPSQALTHFVTRFTCAESEVEEFAAKQGIAPGTVVGQLQHRKVLYYAQMNGLKQRYV
ncbi:hypothetical protein EOD23_09745 [Mesorhizobium sp. USDA-HM6]|nr:hypothetical protein EOD23_09745 [Mesorhizobium sp. USDA-HM6]